MRKLTKKMKVKDKNNITKITASNLRSGGMQGRLHRQEILRYGKEIEKHNKIQDSFNVQSFEHEVSEQLEDFHKPVFRRIRSRRGFFNE